MDMHRTAEMWAEDDMEADTEAFESMIDRLKKLDVGLPNAVSGACFEVQDDVEQAYRAGYKAGQTMMLQENAELRAELNEQEAIINQLSEAIKRNSEEEWD